VFEPSFESNPHPHLSIAHCMFWIKTSNWYQL
jgi:hypothetical protein